MTERQRRFAEEYAKSGKIVESARRAGYSESFADRKAHLLVGKSEVSAAIEQERDKIRKAEGFQTIEQLYEEVSEICEAAKAEGNLHAALKATEQKGKMIGAFVDRIKHSGDEQGEPIQIITVRPRSAD